MISPACVLVPAFDAAATVAGVVTELRAALKLPVIVVDDGSTDDTAAAARAAGADVASHGRNLGKGAALMTGLRLARARGFAVALSVDADGQHPTRSAVTVLHASDDAHALVLGVRDLARAGAPPRNRFGNDVSNYWLSLFSGKALKDTQCGLRRYPVEATLALGVHATGYAFEAEVILLALASGLAVVEVPIDVLYAPVHAAGSHFRPWRDATRIVLTVVRTALSARLGLR